MEEPRTEMGKRLDREWAEHDFPTHPVPGWIEYCDPWGRECTMGRWAELWTGRHDLTFAYDSGIEHPEDDSWWCLGKTEIGDECHVSTVWIGMNHALSMRADDEPMIFETMVFGGPLDEEQERYSRRDAAIEGHERMVRLVRTEIDVTS